jgi:hypothetical protein
VRWRPISVNNVATMVRRIYQLKITLTDVDPPVWRRVLVPGGYTLDRVHRVIQYAMGWQDCHLHSFDVGGAQYGVPDPDGLLDLADELDCRLDVAVLKDQRLGYTYDFGDWWEHDVVVEDVLAAEPDVGYPCCIGGERACPPENCGGPGGYARLLEALADPAHPEHIDLRDWVRPGFDAENFDPGFVSTLLRRLT